jgi:serine/threonine protein phosphatase PrpC
LFEYALFIGERPFSTGYVKSKSQKAAANASQGWNELRGLMMRIECAGRTHVGLKRKINEDSILSQAERGLWAVADGMGGHEAGEVASSMVVDALRSLPPARDAEGLAACAIEALREVNRDLIALARTGGHQRSIGTTVVGLTISDGAFRCFWLGDSRGYRLRDGQLKRLTRDHSVVQELVDAGMLTDDEAEGHEDSNLITRAVGVAETAEIDMIGGEVRSGDLFLLASDGLTRVVPDSDLAAELARASLEEAADNLIDLVLARGAPDNVSLIIVKLG